MIGMMVVGWLADSYDPIVSMVTIGAVSLGAAVVTAAMIPWCYRLQRGEKEKNIWVSPVETIFAEFRGEEECVGQYPDRDR